MQRSWIYWAAVMMTACTGTVGDEPDETTHSAGGEPSAGRGGTSSQVETTGTMPLRRLSREEYANTLRDLLGQAPKSHELFSVDESGPFGYAQGGAVSSQEVDRMLESTATLIDRFVMSQLKTMAPCTPKDEDDRACVGSIVKWFGSRAFRRQLGATEHASLMKSFDTARASASLSNSLKETLQVTLLSPGFHYHWERGDEAPVVKNGLVVLTGFEVASRLSYFLWQTMPDDELLAAAQAGQLTNAAAVGAQVKRMLMDPKASQGIRGFVTAWLPLRGLRSDDTSLGDHATRVSMKESLLKFVDDLIVGEGDGLFQTLMAGDYAFVDGEVSKLLGMTNVETTGTMQRKPFVDAARAGLFTQPAFLAATADTTLATIIHRGRFVYERLGSCAAVPPPTGAIPPPPPKPPNASVREHMSAHANEGVCRGCHQFMDPMGFAFDNFDTMGRARSTDDYGKPTDTSGQMPLNDEVMIQFEDAADLMRQLGKQDPALRCFARQLFGYALRLPNDDANERAIVDVEDGFVADNGNIKQLMARLATANAFYVRQPAEGEVLR